MKILKGKTNLPKGSKRKTFSIPFGISDRNLWLRDKECSFCYEPATCITVVKAYGEYRCEKHKGLPFLFQSGNENPSYRKPEKEQEIR